ncbi:MULTISPECIES: hypothetical protein [Idiomarina]|jgi:uncharacterized membrane protein|uniref:Uncharacterized protein n=1 Tax=Idiomarina abyssalis TaxID=86102 RepID=A0A8I1G9Z0_9GAMM|nr:MULTISPECIES: hypothetical protein [Idiomarina]KPD22458.1 membrane protein [Idiomarina abyssalis]MAB21759.1 hypothetical protein [Idiomarina sp.]MAL83882.1 hypothetical protein [Idiomarina sp.]MBE92405.1 hypothetical protein [Idiomarina sp.]MBH95120.1 hypothetical protein [Idiomarina sp.]|tara:strand:- start:112 stop:372 length:261 start_codon:yes stop_codon:yes gene_type:complete
MWQRVLALLILIAGLLMAVLGVVSDNDTNVRLSGAVLMLIGIIWLYKQPTLKSLNRTDKPTLKWYQSPILWVPVIAIILFIISLFM